LREGTCVGKAAIQKDLERFVADKSRRVTPINTYASGNVLVTRFEAAVPLSRKLESNASSSGNSRDARGKIASTRCCLPERTDPQTARFLEWDYAHPST